MKKTLLLSFFSLCLFSVAAQELQGWHIGVALQPYNYWLRNQDIIDAEPNLIIFKQPKLGIPNGFAGGFTFAKYYTDRFGIKGELTYSRQIQQYGQDVGSNATFSMFRQLDYIKLPVMATFLIVPSERLSLYADAGVQVSFLTRYRAEQHYKGIINSSYYDYYYENKKYYGAASLDGKLKYLSAKSDLAFKRLQIGTLAEVGCLYSINNNWNINLGVRGEYDIIKAENKSAKSYYDPAGTYTWEGSFLLTPFKDRSFSHNIRLGISLSLTYKID